jgi:hypothetical protein
VGKCHWKTSSAIVEWIKQLDYYSYV